MNIFSNLLPERRETVRYRGFAIGHGAQLQAIRLGARAKVIQAQREAANLVVAINQAGETNRQLAVRLRAEAQAEVQAETQPVAAPKRTRKKAAVAVEG